MNSRDLKHLDPALRPLCEAFVSQCEKAGVQVIVTQTYRSTAYQNELFAQGRTQAELEAAGVETPAQPKKPKVTNAKGGKSPHNCTAAGVPASRAFDIAIRYPDGTLNWTTSSKAWATAGVIGLKLGLDWGGQWTRFKDFPHFQLKNWKTDATF